MKLDNGKVKLTISSYIKITTIIVGLIVTGTVAWTMAKGDIKANAQEIAEASTERDEIRKVNQQQNDDIVRIKQDVSHIKEDVGEIKTIQSGNTELLNRIWGKLDK